MYLSQLSLDWCPEHLSFRRPNLPSSLVLTPPVAVPPRHPMAGPSPPFSTPSVRSLDLSIPLLSLCLLKRTIISARLASSPTPSLPHPYHLMCPPLQPNAHNLRQACSTLIRFPSTLIVSPSQRDRVFDPRIPGYNGSAGPIQGVVNMSPVRPPQRKGCMSQYARNQLEQLQTKFDELEATGVFKPPEDLGVVAEYLNPSFLVKKSGGFRLVTAFTDVGRNGKAQPSLMPDVDSTLRQIACWRYIIVSDLSQSFYQIPLCKNCLKYCGVAIPFKGVRVYTRCAMGMPGSETALEELMCRVLGDLLQNGLHYQNRRWSLLRW